MDKPMTPQERTLTMEKHDYAKSGYKYSFHHSRFSRFVGAHGIVCPECKGEGGEIDYISLEIGGPFEPCGWCEGTGMISPHLWAIWMNYAREARREEKKIQEEIINGTAKCMVGSKSDHPCQKKPNWWSEGFYTPASAYCDEHARERGFRKLHHVAPQGGKDR